MKEGDISKLITDQVDEIESIERKQFIKDILAFERSKMDLDQPHYKKHYQDKIEEYALQQGDE